MASEVNFVRLILFNVGAIAIVLGVYLRESPRSRLAAPLATVAVVLANAWVLVMLLMSIGRPVFPEPDPTFRPIVAVAESALWLADAVYGLVAWRLGLVGVGWILFGITLATRRKARTQTGLNDSNG